MKYRLCLSRSRRSRSRLSRPRRREGKDACLIQVRIRQNPKSKKQRKRVLRRVEIWAGGTSLLSKTLTFSGNSAFWGAVWGPVRILHPHWQGKSAFLKLPQSTSASGYKHYKCYITKLQGLIWGRGTGKAGEWEELTQGTQGKRHKSVASCLLRVSARRLLSELQG